MACGAAVIAGKWHPVVVHRLLERGEASFGDLASDMGAVTNKVLSETLDDLETDGIVERTVVDDQPLRVSYSLTADGEALAPVIDALETWGRRRRDG